MAGWERAVPEGEPEDWTGLEHAVAAAVAEHRHFHGDPFQGQMEQPGSGGAAAAWAWTAGANPGMVPMAAPAQATACVQQQYDDARRLQEEENILRRAREIEAARQAPVLSNQRMQ
ncbi:hypothetical protein AK812_SmicGene38619, partial [Symbiodinium microadriaticum]